MFNIIIIFIFRMGPWKTTVKRVKGETVGSSPPSPPKQMSSKPTNKKLYVKFEIFWLWPERRVDYTNINENPFFRFYMQKLGLKEYNRYVHLSACIEIVQTFYANLEPALANQLAPRRRQDILIYKRRDLKGSPNTRHTRNRALVLESSKC